MQAKACILITRPQKIGHAGNLGKNSRIHQITPPVGPATQRAFLWRMPAYRHRPLVPERVKQNLRHGDYLPGEIHRLPEGEITRVRTAGGNDTRNQGPRLRLAAL